jgi:hypothetical protein
MRNLFQSGFADPAKWFRYERSVTGTGRGRYPFSAEARSLVVP